MKVLIGKIREKILSACKLNENSFMVDSCLSLLESRCG